LSETTLLVNGRRIRADRGVGATFWNLDGSVVAGGCATCSFKILREYIPPESLRPWLAFASNRSMNSFSAD